MYSSTTNSSLDSLVAKFNLMTTDFIFSKHQCIHKTIAIAEQLQKICHHPELPFFPEQQSIYLKMHKVWKALAFELSTTSKEKSTMPIKQETPQAIH